MPLTPWIAPSILSADFARLGEEVDAVLEAGADIVHFDVMDNHYVPNLTIGPLVCEALRKHGVTAPIDVHLMVKPVDRIVPDFAKAGATYITFHPEASEHVDRTIGLIREVGCKPGLVFNPATPLSYLDYVLDKLDMVLLMSVNPGFGGQSFIPSALPKLQRSAQADRSQRPSDPPRGGRRREGRQHPRRRGGGRGYVRRGVSDLRREGLRGDDRLDARADREGSARLATDLSGWTIPRRSRFAPRRFPRRSAGTVGSRSRPRVRGTTRGRRGCPSPARSVAASRAGRRSS